MSVCLCISTYEYKYNYKYKSIYIYIHKYTHICMTRCLHVCGCLCTYQCRSNQFISGYWCLCWLLWAINVQMWAPGSTDTHLLCLFCPRSAPRHHGERWLRQLDAHAACLPSSTTSARQAGFPKLARLELANSSSGKQIHNTTRWIVVQDEKFWMNMKGCLLAPTRSNGQVCFLQTAELLPSLFMSNRRTADLSSSSIFKNILAASTCQFIFKQSLKQAKRSY